MHSTSTLTSHQLSILGLPSFQSHVLVIAPQEEEQTAALDEWEATAWNEKIVIKQEAEEQASMEQFVMGLQVKEECDQSIASSYGSCETDGGDKSHWKRRFDKSVGSNVSSSSGASNVDSDGLAIVTDSKSFLEEPEFSRPAEKRRRISSYGKDTFEPRCSIEVKKDEMDSTALGNSQQSYAAGASGEVQPEAEASGEADNKIEASSVVELLSDVSVQTVTNASLTPSAQNKTSDEGNAEKQDEAGKRQTDSAGAPGVWVGIAYYICFTFICLINKQI